MLINATKERRIRSTGRTRDDSRAICDVRYWWRMDGWVDEWMDEWMDECHGCVKPCIARLFFYSIYLFILLESGNQSTIVSSGQERDRERERGMIQAWRRLDTEVFGLLLSEAHIY